MSKKEYEENYRNSRKEAMFLRYSLDNLPKITKANGDYNFKGTLFEYNLKQEIEFLTDLVVLATPLVAPEEFGKLAPML